MSKLNLNEISHPVNFAKMEELILDYWDNIDAFNRSVSERPKDKPYVFYDGPPFATGTPHYGHLLGSIMKDIFPRYYTMKGFRVERKWGWDCHGLPIENIIEQELGLKGGKKGIEAHGIDKFNAACRSAILRFDKEWEKVIRRIGRWVDFKNSYKTMDTSYMESVWWGFQQLYNKGLVYQGRKVILYCPRCSTPLSNFEIAMDNSYQEVTDVATTYKFPVKNEKSTYLLAWSTTPWNKLVTPALGVNPSLTYVTVIQGDERYILAETTTNMLDGEYEIVNRQTGKQLETLEFDLLYDFYPKRNGAKAGVIVADDFVTADEGTGIVTLAVYGEDDYRVMQEHQIQSVEHVDDAGKLKPEITPWAGMDILTANPLIDEELKSRGLIYKQEPYIHSVPTCYRCATRLYYAPIPAWFIDIQKIKDQLIANNESINWVPNHLKHGRFGKGLETAPDWNISRSRFWGTPMPIWIGEKTGAVRVIGSIDELKKWAVHSEEVANITDIHREHIDHIALFVDDEKIEIGHKVPEVFDCWVESGSMPFASMHYPFEQKEVFESRFPAQFISEYIAQTRAWFYTLHVMSAGLFGSHAFENALTTGTIMAEDGTKMSKSKKNYPDPMKVIDQYGVDSLRLYFASSSIMKTAQNVNFNQEAINDIKKKTINILWNTCSFYKLINDKNDQYGYDSLGDNVLDQWLVSTTQQLIGRVTRAMDAYDVVSASKALMEHISDLSTWYVRRSRDRLRSQEGSSVQIFKTVLKDISLLLAPFAPFIAESIYHQLPNQSQDSVHLDNWPEYQTKYVNERLETEMREARLIVERTHALRKEAGLNVRQPLAAITVTSSQVKPSQKILDVIAEEVNVKQVIWQTGSEMEVVLDTAITKSLRSEGEAREIVRKIQNARKNEQTPINHAITVHLPAWPKEYESEIKAKVKARALIQHDTFSIQDAGIWES